MGTSFHTPPAIGRKGANKLPVDGVRWLERPQPWPLMLPLLSKMNNRVIQHSALGETRTSLGRPRARTADAYHRWRPRYDYSRAPALYTIPSSIRQSYFIIRNPIGPHMGRKWTRPNHFENVRNLLQGPGPRGLQLKSGSYIPALLQPSSMRSPDNVEPRISSVSPRA